MPTLVPAYPDPLLSSINIFLIVGVVVFAICMLAMVVLFGFSLKDFSRKGRNLTVVFLLTLALPLILYSSTRQTRYQASAQALPQVTQLVTSSDQSRLSVDITTDRPAVVYLEVLPPGASSPIQVLPDQPIQPRTRHTFSAPQPQDSSPLYINIDGHRFEVRF